MMLVLRRRTNTPGEFWERACLCPPSATSCGELSEVSKMNKRRNRAIDVEWIIATFWTSLFIVGLTRFQLGEMVFFFLYVVDSKPGWSWFVQQNVICGHERLRNGCQRRSEVSGRKNLKNWLLGIFSISTLPVFSRDLHSRLPRFFDHHLPTLQLVFAFFIHSIAVLVFHSFCGHSFGLSC